jgi:two-component system, LytTR family, sensor kinase
MKNYKYHILFWITNYLTYCLVHFSTLSTKVYWFSLLILFLNLLPYVAIFYFLLYYIIPNFWDNKKYLGSILIFILVITSNFLLKKQASIYFPIFQEDSSLLLATVNDIILDIFTLTFIFPFAFAFYYVKKINIQQKLKSQIQQENYQLEQAIVNNQLNNLKNQINPEFLFDKLNHFYQESLNYSPNLSKGIALLTDMMKYAINDEDDKGRVSLSKEIKHIQNFIEINQLRFDSRLQVKFEVLGVEEYHQIMPLILITFVENAFKYGELFDKNSPLKITLEVRENQLFFHTFNKVHGGPTEQSEGIGIANTQKRLALGYPNHYSLDIHHQKPYYEVKLHLDLAHLG